MAKNILVTGSSGFIGKYVVKEALNKGYSVKGFDIKGNNKDRDSIKADTRDKSALSNAIKHTDYVIHLAAITSVVEFEKDPVRCFDINVNGFLNVLSLALEHKVKKVLYASSAAVYTGEHFSDSLPLDYRKQNNPYALSKMMNEMHAQYFNKSKDFNSTGLRFFNVFGDGENAKGQYASIATIFLENKRKNEPLLIYGDGSQARDMIHAEDVARIVLKLLEKGNNGVYNVGTGKAVSYEHVADLIDKKHKKHVANPLKAYQHLTKADTKKLFSTIGHYNFQSIDEWITKKL